MRSNFFGFVSMLIMICVSMLLTSSAMATTTDPQDAVPHILNGVTVTLSQNASSKLMTTSQIQHTGQFANKQACEEAAHGIAEAPMVKPVLMTDTDFNNKFSAVIGYTRHKCSPKTILAPPAQ